MKILQLIQKPQWRGAEIFASQLSNHLVKLGHEVTMVCVTPGSDALPFKGRILYLNRPLGIRFIDWVGWRQLANLIKELEPEVIQANAGDTLKFAVFSKLLGKWSTPIIYRNANKVSDFLDSSVKKMFNRFLARQVSHIISVSEICRLDFIKAYDLEVSKVTTVPIGIELSQGKPAIPQDLLSFFLKSKVLLSVGSMVPEKNHIRLLHMMRQSIDQGLDIKLLIIGEGRLKAEIVRVIGELKLTNHILLAGNRADVWSVMANADALVMPSVIEGLPGVILEAMYCRLPVIAYDVGGIPEVVKPGVTGWVVPRGDEISFVNTIKEVVGNNDHATILEHAYELVVNEFDNEKITQRFLAVYHQIADQNSSDVNPNSRVMNR